MKESIEQAAYHLNDAARVLESWASVIRKHDQGGARKTDIEWLNARAGQYRASADNLQPERQD